ncbi:MAG: hypothetical protein Q9160_007260 [Pyrenula sp. 1 TL-2023]
MKYTSLALLLSQLNSALADGGNVCPSAGPKAPYQDITYAESLAVHKGVLQEILGRQICDAWEPGKRDGGNSISYPHSAKFTKRASTELVPVSPSDEPRFVSLAWNFLTDVVQPPTPPPDPYAPVQARFGWQSYYDIVNSFLLVSIRCGIVFAKAFAGFFTFGLDVGTPQEIRRAALANFGNFMVTGAIVGSALIGAALALWIHNHPSPAPPSQLEPKVMYTNFRTTFRDSPPVGFRHSGDKKVCVGAIGNIPNDPTSRHFLTDSDCNPIGDGPPPATPRSATSTNTNTPVPLPRHDEKHDDFGAPTRKEDFTAILYHLWKDVFVPRAGRGQTGMTFSLYHRGLAAANDLVAGGIVRISMWLTETPDFEALHAPALDETLQSPDWKYTPVDVRNAECFEAYVPARASVTDPGPKGHWWNTFSDRCKAALGGSEAAVPRPFQYAGPGRIVDPETGLGWRGEYVPDGCTERIRCVDLVGSGGDGKTGDALHFAEMCRARTADHRFHGGIYYHFTRQQADRSDEEDPYKGDVDPPQRPSAPCGYMKFTPLGEDWPVDPVP